MTRRELLKKSSLILGGMLLLPDVLSALDNKVVDNQHFAFGDLQSDLIGEIAEHIIPTTETPGAKAAGVPDFIKKLVADCLTEKDRNAFLEGLMSFETNITNQTSKPFLKHNSAEQVAFLKNVQNEFFFRTLKEMTIMGYFTSEIGATQAMRYEAIPGRYEGEVNYKKSDRGLGY